MVMFLFRYHFPKLQVKYTLEDLDYAEHSSSKAKLNIDVAINKYKRSKIIEKLHMDGDIRSSTHRIIWKDVVFTTYAPAVFERLRTGLGIQSDAFISVRMSKEAYKIHQGYQHCNFLSQFLNSKTKFKNLTNYL